MSSCCRFSLFLMPLQSWSVDKAASEAQHRMPACLPTQHLILLLSSVVLSLLSIPPVKQTSLASREVWGISQEPFLGETPRCRWVWMVSLCLWQRSSVDFRLHQSWPQLQRYRAYHRHGPQIPALFSDLEH